MTGTPGPEHDDQDKLRVKVDRTSGSERRVSDAVAREEKRGSLGRVVWLGTRVERRERERERESKTSVDARACGGCLSVCLSIVCDSFGSRYFIDVV